MKRYAFFDLDYTLIGHDTITLLINYAVRKNPLRLYYLFFTVPLLLPAALKLISPKPLKRAFLSVLWGMKEQEVKNFLEEFTDHSVIPELFPSMVRETERCRREGYTLILNSASVSAYTDIIAERLGFDISIGTALRIDPVMPVIPAIEGPNNKRAVKILKMMEHLPAEIQSEWKHYTYEMAARKEPWPEKSIPGARAYSDSRADLPMLALAEEVFLINPSPSFESLGEQKGWTVLRPELPFRSAFEKYFLIARQLLGLYSR